MPNFKTKRNILHIVILVLACLAGIVLADVTCFGCDGHFIENQFIDGTVYGYLIVACLLFGAMLFDEVIPEKTSYLLCAGGAFLYFITTICVLLYGYSTYYKYNNYTDSESSNYPKARILCGAILCLILGALYLSELLLSLLKKEVLD